jgi:hypothetical protein
VFSVVAPLSMKRGGLLYIGTIVLPACVLLGLGIQSFQRQRQVVETLNTEKLAANLDQQTRDAAETALAHHTHPIGRFYFEIENGKVVRPAVHASLPEPLPASSCRCGPPGDGSTGSRSAVLPENACLR